MAFAPLHGFAPLSETLGLTRLPSESKLISAREAVDSFMSRDQKTVDSFSHTAKNNQPIPCKVTRGL